MSTFGSILSIARSAISAHQAAMQTVSHNLANAETEGYSRQRAELHAADPQRLPFGSVGTGVDIGNVVRLREQLLDANYRREVGNREAFSLKHDLLSEIEAVLGEPSETGLSNALDQFWNSWSDLSNNPSNAGVQSVVKQRGAQVAYALNSMTSRIADVSARARDRLSNTVAEINSIAKDFAELNTQITAAESSGNQAPDLRDRRDQLADRLAMLAGARVEPQANGTVGVYIGSMMLVDASLARTLEVRTTPTLSLGLKGDPDPLVGVAGALATTVDFVTIDVPTVQTRLDALAKALVRGVNEVHASGWTAAGDALGGANWNPLTPPTGSRVDFFDATSITAGTIKLSAAVQADARVIASGDVQNAPGNNAVAMAIGALRDDNGVAALAARMGGAFSTQVGLASGESFGDHYSQTVSDLGVRVDDARTKFDIFDTVTRAADNQRASVMGVSIDEELTLMMRHQQAYAAATKVVNAVDEMAQSILAMV